MIKSLLLAALLAFPSLAMDFATQATHQLEQLYLEDCQVDTTPRGYYGAFLQPCTFEFRSSDANTGGDACSNEHSTLVSKPVPMHWFFNLTDHFDKDDWDSMSSDDIPSAEDMMLWPDQCVGAVPRCYNLAEANDDIKDTLARLFPDGTPDDATHVRVDCTGDAAALSRVIYSFADGFEKSAPYLIASVVTFVLLILVLAMWCIYACLRLCMGPQSKTACDYEPVMVRGKAIPTSDYKVMEEGNAEKSRLLKK
jgi:hypothetical protein